MTDALTDVVIRNSEASSLREKNRLVRVRKDAQERLKRLSDFENDVTSYDMAYARRVAGVIGGIAELIKENPPTEKEKYQEILTKYSIRSNDDFLSIKTGYVSEANIVELSEKYPDEFSINDALVNEIKEQGKDDGLSLPTLTYACRIETGRVLVQLGGNSATIDPSQFPRMLMYCESSIKKFSRELDKFSRTSEIIVSYISKIKEYINTGISAINTRIEDLEEDILSISKLKREDPEYLERDISNQMLIAIAITISIFAGIMASVMWAIIKLATAENKNQDETTRFTYPIFLELVTVFVLTVTILILGLTNKLENEALAALIGGISGYVLGRIKQSSEKQAVAATPPPSPAPPQPVV
ncbi:hypothetical protein [Mesorhizobium sp. J428]|uniref:hypothetical protein n=1 Tax=Mesorhizobium sp. J428 TaxID=2898440 RepID=UPI002150D32C|nr:hypothetical protein [Mesorhizobium sp. J428]MCR5855607.1 hypothetical protein [Mesorhizobium sp. J428]